MKKLLGSPAVHPLLVGMLPVFVLYTGNMTNITFTQAYRSLLVTLLLSAALLLLARLLLRDPHRAGLAATVFLFFFDNFGHFAALLERLSLAPVLRLQIALAVVLPVMIVSLWAVIRLLRSPRSATLPLNAAALGLLLFNLASIGLYEAGQRLWRPPQAVAALSVPAATPTPGQRDIYFIVLDGYTRADVLEELYDIDSGPFLDGLVRKGFVVAGASRSNYSQTALSLTATFTMDYVTPPASPPELESGRRRLNEMVSGGQVVRRLRAQGYRIVMLEPPLEETYLTGADLVIRSEQQLNRFESTLIGNSMALFFQKEIARPLDYAGMNARFEQLVSAASLPGPKFVYAHFLIPHPPFLFDRDGRLQPGQYAEGSDGSHFRGTREEYRTGYREQLLYLNRRVADMLDQILAQPGPEPIIILQGDHGSGMYLDQYSLENTCARERLSILSAYYLPGGADLLYPSITPVNDFRVIFNAYFGADLPLLEDASYYSPWDYPFDLTRVTEVQLEQPCE